MNSLLKFWKTQKVTKKKVIAIYRTTKLRLPWLTFLFLNYICLAAQNLEPDRLKFKFHFRQLLVE